MKNKGINIARCTFQSVNKTFFTCLLTSPIRHAFQQYQIICILPCKQIISMQCIAINKKSKA